ncbi:Phosphatidylserine decarboxylase-related [Dillenia turbinata]|uniref:Phosphatidylserine decarboxylase-related n=1 Tax=Dillenia turbinata TaxID=194707 RepID=A0AAN8UX42_9MAGN
MKQNGESIESYYNGLQDLWREIDFRHPNPMEYAIDIPKYNTFIKEDHVYVFLDGEDIRQSVMLSQNDNVTVAAMISKGTKSGSALLVPNEQKQDDWIVDSGATDHMTLCSNDFTKNTRARRTSISNANGVMYPVIGAGTVDLSPTTSLSNTLLVNSLAVNSKYCNVFAENKRVVSSSKDFGKVAFVAIGATMVGSIPFSKNEGDYTQKGDEYISLHGNPVCQAIGRVVEVKPQNCYHEKIKTCEILLGARRSYLEEQEVSGLHPLVDLIALNLATCTPN